MLRQKASAALASSSAGPTRAQDAGSARRGASRVIMGMSRAKKHTGET